MQKFKTIYEYLFFFLYNSVNSIRGNIFVKTKAIFLVAVLDLILLCSIYTYYIVIYKAQLVSKEVFLTPVCLLAVLNVLFFNNKNTTTFISEFESWPENKRKKWNWIMRVIIALIVGNFIFSFYCMSQIDWKQYR